MTSLLNPILQRFAEHFPIPTMARAVLERCLNPQHLDAWCETVAEGQYTRTLLFSTLFELMMQVVSRQQPSIHAAYQAAPEPIAVSVKSVYNKLHGWEPGTAAALVRDSAEQVAALIAAVGGARPGLLAGYRVKILDGNWLWGLHARGAVGLVREHAQIRFEPLEAMRVIGEIDSGRVSEQRVWIDAPDGSGTLVVRWIRLELYQPTRDGDDTLYLLTTVPAAAADACTLARLYRERWTLEQAFLHLTVQLCCEIHTLAYPPAALFGLALAVVAYNGLAVVKATPRQVHGAAAIDTGVSGYTSSTKWPA